MEYILYFIKWYLLGGIAIFLYTWFCFVVLMWGRKHWGKWWVYPFAPFLAFFGITGWVGDVVFNIFYASIIFWMPPDIYKGMRIHDITLSHRLRQIFRYDTPIRPQMIRWKIADFFCTYFIEPSDKPHCGRFK